MNYGIFFAVCGAVVVVDVIFVVIEIIICHILLIIILRAPNESWVN